MDKSYCVSEEVRTMVENQVKEIASDIEKTYIKIIEEVRKQGFGKA